MSNRAVLYIEKKEKDGQLKETIKHDDARPRKRKLREPFLLYVATRLFS